MTREEAIRLIGWLKCTTNREDDLEAIDLAIEALSADAVDVNDVTIHYKPYPSAEAESDDLIIKGAKGIKDGLYNIADGKLFQYKAKGGTVRTYPIVPSADRPIRLYEEGAIELLRMTGWLTEHDKEIGRLQGEWTRKEDLQTYWYECSVCGEKPPRDQFGHETHSNYCPNCGSRMENTE